MHCSRSCVLLYVIITQIFNLTQLPHIFSPSKALRFLGSSDWLVCVTWCECYTLIGVFVSRGVCHVTSVLLLWVWFLTNHFCSCLTNIVWNLRLLFINFYLILPFRGCGNVPTFCFFTQCRPQERRGNIP